MTGISKTIVSLRFYGDDLDPENLSAMLGGQPSSSARKGDALQSGQLVKTGRWVLRAQMREPGDLNAQIGEILAKLTADLDIWAKVTTQFQTDLFCSLVLEETNEGIALDIESIEQLSARAIPLSLDVYGPETSEGGGVC